MPWNDLASNQMVSYTDAQTSPFSLKPGQSSVTSNQCMTRLDIVTKYNVNINPLLCADNQLASKSLWESGGFSATMTVGNVGASNVLWGYDRVDQNIGNMSNTNVSVPAGVNSSLVTLRWADPAGGNLILRINNGNNSVAPNGWNSLNISGSNFSRNSGGSLVGNGLWQWVWMGVSANPFGTTVGATRTITLT